MAHWTLSFDQPLPWDDLTLALGALANAFTGQQHPWQQQLHQTLEDRDYANACFRRELTRPDATLSALQESGDGNPRDGYGYQQRLTLTLHDPPLSFQAHNSGWEPSWRELHLSFQSNRTQDLQIARDALRAALDPQRDRTMTAHTAHTNIEQARDLDPQTARAWLAEALTHGPSGQALQRLLALDAQLNGNDPDKLARRLRETPQDADAWRDPLADTHTAAHQVRARLDAPHPVSAWRRFEDGLGPLPGRNNPIHEVERALWGEPLPYNTHFGPNARELRAAWTDGPLPRLAIADTHRDHNTVTHTLSFWGEHPTQRLTLRWQLHTTSGRTLHLGFAASIDGPPDFQSRALNALSHLGHGHWTPCLLTDLFAEQQPRDLTLADPALPPRAHAAALLAITAADTPDALAALRECRCSDYACTHARALIDLQRARQRDAQHPTSPLAQHAAYAQAAALGAALIALQDPKKYNNHYNIRAAEQQWAQRNALANPPLTR